MSLGVIASHAAAGGGAGRAAFQAAQLAAASPLGVWGAEETTGTTLADLTGNSRDWTLNASISGGGGASLHSDNNGHSLALTETGTQYGTMASASWQYPSTGLTLELLVYFTSAADSSNGDELFSKWTSTNYHMWRTTTGKLGFELSTAAGATRSLVCSTTLAINTLYHLVVTKDDNDLRGYVNGVLDGGWGSGFGNAAVGAGIYAPASGMQLGRRLSTNGSIPGARFDSMGMFGAPHSAAAIAARTALI